MKQPNSKCKLPGQKRRKRRRTRAVLLLRMSTTTPVKTNEAIVNAMITFRLEMTPAKAANAEPGETMRFIGKR